MFLIALRKGSVITGVNQSSSLLIYLQYHISIILFYFSSTIPEVRQWYHIEQICCIPREGHLKQAIKILGYLKKYQKKGYIIDPRHPVVNIKYWYKQMKPDFGNQHSNFVEEENPKLPAAKTKELPVSIIVDSNHGHDKIIRKSSTGIIVFVGRTPMYWESKRQSSIQTTTFKAEFVSTKKAVEEAVTT